MSLPGCVVFARTNDLERLSCTVTLVLPLKDVGFFVSGSLLGVLLLMLLPKWECLGLPLIGGGTAISPRGRLVCLTGLLDLTAHRSGLAQNWKLEFCGSVGNENWVRYVSV